MEDGGTIGAGIAGIYFTTVFGEKE